MCAGLRSAHACSNLIMSSKDVSLQVCCMLTAVGQVIEAQAACMQKWQEDLVDGYMATGDVMEQRGPKTVIWIDRKKNIMKLSQVGAVCDRS